LLCCPVVLSICSIALTRKNALWIVCLTALVLGLLVSDLSLVLFIALPAGLVLALSLSRTDHDFNAAKLGDGDELHPLLLVAAILSALIIVDGILCESTIAHIADADAALREARRVLKEGGRLYLTVPFLWPFHGSPDDYRRWSAMGVLWDLRGFEIVASGIAGGPTTALCNILHEWLAMVFSFNIEGLYRFIYLALIPVLSPPKLLDYVVSHHRHAGRLAALFCVHARKPPQTRPRN
jgi:SAM-dependent methyltransferase